MAIFHIILSVLSSQILATAIPATFSGYDGGEALDGIMPRRFFPPNYTSSLNQIDEDEISTNIVGGHPAYLGELPYQVQLLYNNKHFCGGSIVAPSTVVTAAHCLDGISPYPLKVRAGHITSSRPESTVQSPEILEIFMHREYNSITYENDIAVIRLKEPFKITPGSNVATIGLPDQDSTIGTIPGTSYLVASGWGDTYYGSGQGSDQLLRMTVPVVEQSKCNTALGIADGHFGENIISDTMICAGYFGGGTDACTGDSGGPLSLTTRTGAKVLIGVVSFGHECAWRDLPGVYTRVASFTNWIRKYM